MKFYSKNNSWGCHLDADVISLDPGSISDND